MRMSIESEGNPERSAFTIDAVTDSCSEYLLNIYSN